LHWKVISSAGRAAAHPAIDLVEEGREVEIEILGDMIPARLYSAPLFDPKNQYLRG